jgi:hypothetical protein
MTDALGNGGNWPDGGSVWNGWGSGSPTMAGALYQPSWRSPSMWGPQPSYAAWGGPQQMATPQNNPGFTTMPGQPAGYAPRGGQPTPYPGIWGTAGQAPHNPQGAQS